MWYRCSNTADERLSQLRLRVEKLIRDIEETLLPIVERVDREKAELLKHYLKRAKKDLPTITKISLIDRMLTVAATALGEDINKMFSPDFRPPPDLPED